jgi:hypothetical protein
MLIPLCFRIPEDVFLGMGFKTLLESSCGDDKFGAIPVDQGNKGTAFDAELFGKPFGFRQFITFDQFLSGKSTDVLRIRKNIGSMGRPSGTPNAHALAKIKIPLIFPK